MLMVGGKCHERTDCDGYFAGNDGNFVTGAVVKTFDFSQCEEICLVTTCAGNAKLVYTVKIPVIALSEDKIHVCNGGYTAGTGAQCEWEISKTSCRLLACYVGGTNYTASNTVIYAR